MLTAARPPAFTFFLHQSPRPQNRYSKYLAESQDQRFTVFQTVNRWSWLKAKYLLYRFYGLGDWCRKNVNAGGLAAVSITDLQKYDIDFPSNETERENISNYFENLELLIAEAEREVNRLEKMKQASLQKMFPRPGDSAPEIRFAGFTEPWHKSLFSDVFSSLKNNTLSRDCLNYERGIAKNIHYGDILIKFGSSINIIEPIVPSAAPAPDFALFSGQVPYRHLPFVSASITSRPNRPILFQSS